MNKDISNHAYDGSNLNLKRKANEEVLEISSTGYGLESVSKMEEKKDEKSPDPSCGGL